MIGIRSFILVKQSEVPEIKERKTNNMDKDYHFVILVVLCIPIGTKILTKFGPKAIKN